MIVGLLIIIIFPFIYFHTQMNNFNQKTNTIRKAIKSEKETYYDITDGHLHWTQNGAFSSSAFTGCWNRSS